MTELGESERLGPREHCKLLHLDYVYFLAEYWQAPGGMRCAPLCGSSGQSPEIELASVGGPL